MCNLLESLNQRNMDTKIRRALYPCKFTLTKDMENTRTTPSHPRSDRIVERLNHTLEAMVSKFVQGKRYCDEPPPLMAMAYRSAIPQKGEKMLVVHSLESRVTFPV